MNAPYNAYNNIEIKMITKETKSIAIGTGYLVTKGIPTTKDITIGAINSQKGGIFLPSE